MRTHLLNILGEPNVKEEQEKLTVQRENFTHMMSMTMNWVIYKRDNMVDLENAIEMIV